MNFKHKIVNDLAWVIGSVPLMSFNQELNRYHELDQEWFKLEYERCNGFLINLDRNPKELENFINVEGRQLLGKRFEKFIEFWLKESGRFKILLSNEQLAKDKITVGEIDYLVQETHTGRNLHLEVACKYYMSSNNSKLWKNWVGLNAKDSLADKMSKFDKQLTVFDRPEGTDLLQRHRIKKPESFLLLKGFFFYHWRQVHASKSPKYSNPNHETGIYAKLSEIPSFFSGWNLWKVLRKVNWFSAYVTAYAEDLTPEIMIESEVRELIKTYDSGVMLARMVEKKGLYVEDLRMVIVPDAWPNN